MESTASTVSKNIYQRMIDVQKKVVTVMKNEKVKQGSEGYKAVSHDDVALLLHSPLAEAGIVLLPTITEQTFSTFQIEKKGDRGSYVQTWYRTDLKLNVKWINADNPTEFFESNGGAYALDTSDKSPAKAYSLALKIILLKVHLLESRDEEEQRLLERTPPADPKKAPPKKDPPAAPLKNHADELQKKDPHPSMDPPTEALDFLVKLVEKKKLPPEYVKKAIEKCVGKVKRANALSLEELEKVIDCIEDNNK